MQGFVDIHSHVIPSGDDGATSVAEGLDLCREAARRGTRVLFGTPHVWPSLPLTAAREQAIRATYADMAPAAAALGLDLRLGWELTPSPALLGEDLARYRLGELGAVLMEVPFHGSLGLAEALAERIESQGLLPVIAHPERSERFVDEPDAAERLVERGWPLQVNATSLLGYHGPQEEATGWRLIDQGLAGLVASDGHRHGRPPHLDEAYGLVRARVGGAADSLFDGRRLGADVVAHGDRVDLAQRA